MVSSSASAHHDGEVAYVSRECGDLRAALEDRAELLGVVGGEVGWVGHDPACDVSRFWRLWADGWGGDGRAEGAQVAAHGLVAAGEALRADLGVEDGGVGAALVPALMQVGPVRVDEA